MAEIIQELEREVNLYGVKELFTTPESIEQVLKWALDMDLKRGEGPLCQTPVYMLINYILKKANENNKT